MENRELKVNVIIRIDDVIGIELRKIANWFLKHHPDVPCSIYLMRTHIDWNIRDWELAKRLIEKYDWEIGGHTRNHLPLTLLSEDKMYKEIKLNIWDIENSLYQLGLPYKVQSFSLPYGDYDDRVLRVLKKLGIRFVLTYPDGYPYQPAENPVEKNGLVIFGVSHSGKPIDLQLYNKRFFEARKRGLYVLSLHSDWGYPSINEVLIEFLIRRRSTYAFLRGLYEHMLGKHNSHYLRILNDHINYIKSTNVAKFTTFRKMKFEFDKFLEGN